VFSTNILVGAPFFDNNGNTDSGLVGVYDLVSGKFKSVLADPGGAANDQFGTSVAPEKPFITPRLTVVGAPGALSNSGIAVAFTGSQVQYLQPNESTFNRFGDSLGSRVAVSGNLAAVGAPADDNEHGSDAGAVFVFRLRGDGSFTQSQKIMAADGRQNDRFGEHGLAMEGKLMVVGAHAHDYDDQNAPFDLNEDRGAVYVFNTNGMTWTQETEIQLNDFSGGEPGMSFGISVALSNSTILIGARAASAAGVTRSGAAYTYTLDCVPPYAATSALNSTDGKDLTDRTVIGEVRGQILELRGGALRLTSWNPLLIPDL
jgi:hypothetical protein